MVPNSAVMKCVLLLCLQVVTAFLKTTDKKILILGGGMSGISAARRLHDLGYTNLEIIEGAGKLGGRIRESHLGGHNIETGAVWINGRGANPVWLLAQKYKMSSVTDVYDWKVYNETGSEVTEEAFQIYQTRFAPAYESLDAKSNRAIKQDLSDYSARAALIEEGWLPKTALEHAVEFYAINYEYATSPEEVSVKYSFYSDHLNASEDEIASKVNDSRGYSHIVRGLAAEFLTDNDSNLHLDETVLRIEESDGMVSVTTNKGSHRADYVIVTFNLGVLQHRKVGFTPELPRWKQSAIDRFAVEIFEHIQFQFPSTFWGESEYIVYAGERSGYFTTWLNLERIHPGCRILQVTVLNDEAKRLLRLSDSAVIEEAMRVLQKIFKDLTVPRPTGFIFTRWGTNPLHYGSYSNWPIAYDMDMYNALLAPVGNVYFAGEYGGFEDYSYTHGAFKSGKRTATQLVSCIEASSSCETYQPASPKVMGCIYSMANNYVQGATHDDGSCSFQCASSKGAIGQVTQSAVAFLLTILLLIF